MKSYYIENKLVFLVKNACQVPLIVKHFLQCRRGQENNEASFKHYRVYTVNSSVNAQNRQSL